MSQQNKAIDRRICDEVYSSGDLSVVDELVARDFIGYGMSPAGIPSQGREEYKQFVTMMRTAFPDLAVTVEDQIAEGDKVVTRFTATGTHTGDFQGIPPTGKRGQISGVTIDRIVNGKVVECWSNTDDLGLLQQLGVIPQQETVETA